MSRGVPVPGLRRAAVLLTVGLALGLPGPATAQSAETRMLREAAARESRGDYEGAERVLRSLLRESPGSSGGLFALERVLRARGTPAALLPAVDAFLARTPESPGVRYLKMSVLVEIDSLATLEDEADALFALDPTEEVSYREVGRIWERAFGPERALEVLRRGRRALGDPGAMALETGDLLAALGRPAEAVTEWAAAVGPDGSQAGAVARRVASLDAATPELRRGLVERVAEGSDPARRRAAASIAVGLGLEDEAERLSRRVAAQLGGRARATFLAEVARDASDAGMGALATWAWGELGRGADTPGERREFDRRLAETLLAAGDTAGAVEAQRRVVASFTPGSVDRRRATAELIRLESAGAGPERLRELLADFRAEFPRAPELDDLAAGVAAKLQGRGDVRGAAQVLEGIEGPRTSLERGYLLLDQGDVALGRHALLLAVAGLAPGDATAVIQFAGLLGRLSPAGTELLAGAGVLAHRGREAEAAQAVAGAVSGLPEEERAAVLAEGARMAARGGAGREAARLRERLLEEHPEAPESAEAALELARYRAGEPAGVPAAIALLEELIATRPDAAVVPDARRELERLRARGSAGPAEDRNETGTEPFDASKGSPT